MQRPALNTSSNREAVEAFVQGLQDAIDVGDAKLFNSQFAQDVMWGSPFGAVAVGYDQIHAIHSRMFASIPAVKGAAKYTVEHSLFPTNDVAIAYIRRIASAGNQGPDSFDELALIVLVRNAGVWWLALHSMYPTGGTSIESSDLASPHVTETDRMPAVVARGVCAILLIVACWLGCFCRDGVQSKWI